MTIKARKIIVNSIRSLILCALLWFTGGYIYQTCNEQLFLQIIGLMDIFAGVIEFALLVGYANHVCNSN